jgi:hypothetical protein
MTCDNCYRRPGAPVVCDDNVECYLCGPCRKVISREMTVRRLDLTR